MKKTTQVTMASCLLSGSVILIAAMGYLTYEFPKTVAVWEDQGRTLSAAELHMISVSNSVAHFGLPIFGFFMLSIIACIVWLAVIIRANRTDSANQQMQTIAARRGPV